MTLVACPCPGVLCTSHDGENRLIFIEISICCCEKLTDERRSSVIVVSVRCYIDDLILREKGVERLYSLADPNWNVVAVTDASGNVVERMKYDAFGKVTWFDAAFTAKASQGSLCDKPPNRS